jgi:uncharacterized protein involved in exopolysaccharide biosynthesis
MASKPSSNYDEEIKIDIGKYIEVLFRQWLLIAICAVMLGGGVLAISLYIKFTSPSYEASAIVSSIKTGSDVNFGSEITSLSATELAAFSDRKARLQSFVVLVNNSDIAEQVLTEIGPKLREKDRTPTALLKMVKGSLIPNTDSIQITVTYRDPDLAAEIANSWARIYTDQINNMYGDLTTGTSETLGSLQTQIAQAKTEYQKAQEDLDQFIAQNKVDEYQRQINDITVVLASLRKAQTTVNDQQVQDPMVRLTQAYSDSRQNELYLERATSMRAAVSAGGDSAAINNSLALTMLKTQIYTFLGNVTMQVDSMPDTQLSDVTTINAAGMVADLDSLISSLQTRRIELNNLIDTLSTEIQNGDHLSALDENSDTTIGKQIEVYEQNIRDLDSLISTQTSTLDELTRERDLALKTYTALATKGAELSIASHTPGSEVAFTAPATPMEDDTTHSVSNAAIATGIGLVIGVVVAYAYEFWQNYKGRKPEVLTKKMVNLRKDLFRRKPIKSPENAARH